MTFLLSFRSELLKIRKSSLAAICLIGAAFIPFLTFLFDNQSAESLRELSTDPWNIYFDNAIQILNILFLPLFTLIVCCLVPQIEHRNNTWKQVLTSPQPFFNVYFGKFLVIQLLIIAFLLLFTLLMCLSLLAVQLFKADVRLFQHSVNWKQQLFMLSRSYICILGVCAFQYWMGVRFKNFIIPLGLGACLWFAAMMVAVEYKQPGAELFFYTHPILSVHPKHVNLVPAIQWYSFGYAIFFLLAGFIDFKKKKLKTS